MSPEELARYPEHVSIVVVVLTLVAVSGLAFWAWRDGLRRERLNPTRHDAIPDPPWWLMLISPYYYGSLSGDVRVRRAQRDAEIARQAGLQAGWSCGCGNVNPVAASSCLKCGVARGA